LRQQRHVLGWPRNTLRFEAFSLGRNPLLRTADPDYEEVTPHYHAAKRNALTTLTTRVHRQNPVPWLDIHAAHGRFVTDEPLLP
jgi:hypothetical protein